MARAFLDAPDASESPGGEDPRLAPPLWVLRSEFLARLAAERCAFDVGVRVWDACEPWVRACLAASPGPEALLAECREWLALLDRHSDIEPISDAPAVFRRAQLHELSADPLECELVRGCIAGLLRDERGDPARVEHPECRAQGAPSCRFVVPELAARTDPAHARLFDEASLLSATLQGREALFRRMARSGAATGPFPDVRELEAVRRFMEDIEDIILIFDRNLCVLDANRAAVKFSGMSLDELRGQSARDLLSANSIRRVAESVPLLIEQGFRRGLRVEGKTRHGWVPLELSARVAENRETVVCIARDIREHLSLERQLAERNRQLQEQNERIREADLLKSEFLANVSHELNTPLTSIRGFAKMLQSELESERKGEPARLDSAKRLEFLRIVHKEADRMRDLIGGLLELSKIESGVVTLDRAWVSLNTIIQDSLMVLKPRLDDRRLTAGLEAGHGLAPAFLDPDRMKQVVLNLLDNAIKFSPEGSRIRIATASERGMLELAVRNPARDMTAEHLERIFDRFVQRDGSFKREQGGVGLGLNLVRAIVELHGGKVWSELVEPGVIEFRVRLPFSN